MCRNVKLKITYLKVRLSLRLVRSLRAIRGRFRRFPIGVVPPLERSGRPAIRSILTIVLSEPTSQNTLWASLVTKGATNQHKNHISIKPDKFPIIQPPQGDHKTIFCRRKLEWYSTIIIIRQHKHVWTMFDVYGCLKPPGTRTLRSYWSVQIHATREQFVSG